MATENKDNWKNRRPVIRLTLLFCAAVIVYCTYKIFNTDPACGENANVGTLITSAFTLAGGVVLGYIGGAAWEENTKTKVGADVPTDKNMAG